MNIAFYDGMLLQVVLQGDKATVLSKREIGTDTINFYNYFMRYCLSPEEPILKLSNCADDEIIEIISGQPLVNQFYVDAVSNHIGTSTKSNQAATQEALTHTCNLVQQAFSELDAAFSERLNTNNHNTHKKPDDSKAVFMPKQVTTTFASLNSRIVPVYTVKDLCEYLALDFYYTNHPQKSVKHIAICPCCKKAFRKSQRNKLYCSKYCKDVSIRENNKSDLYYSKYRYLQQYNNRQLNKQRRQMADSPQQTKKLQEAYDAWNKWAWTEYELATKTSGPMQQETVEEFAERLKGKWKVLMAEAAAIR